MNNPTQSGQLLTECFFMYNPTQSGQLLTECFFYE